MADLMKGIAGQDTANYNAEVAHNAATAAGTDAAAAEARTRMDARAAMGEAVAAGGASGFQLGTGSMLDVLRESAVNSSMDALTIRAKGANAVKAANAEAGLQSATGKNAFTAGLVSTSYQAAKLAVGAGG